MPWIWGVIFVITLIIELQSADLDAIWFSIGALVTLIVNLIFPKLSLVWQLLIFIIVTVILLLTIGKWVKKKFKSKNISTNSDALVGKEITILEDCNEFDKGSGTINDVIWTTICQSGHSLKKGDQAIIVAIEGNKLVVKEKESSNNV
jgi:membrane protein implicated in regulation of membrane protease activity